jgi:hypothetical protein
VEAVLLTLVVVEVHLSKVQALAEQVEQAVVETEQLLVVHQPQEQQIQAVVVVVGILAEYLLVGQELLLFLTQVLSEVLEVL